MTDKIIKKLCIDLDVEFIFKLPKSLQDFIFENAKNIDTPIANFFVKFIQLNNQQIYNNYNTISLQLERKKDKENKEDKIINTFIKLDLDKKILESKNNIDIFHAFDKKKLQYYIDYSKYFDQFKHYIQTEIKTRNQTKNFTNAWLKCWEIINFYKLIPSNHSDNFTVFCNAEFPGAFIFSINHYIKTVTQNKNYEWFANSLWPGFGKDKKILGDEFGLYKKYNEKWLMNDKEASGDVTNSEMNKIIQQKLAGKVDLYTSDIGIELKIEEMNDEETIEAPLNLGQIICALNTLKEGGHMVCKTFLFFKPFTMSLLYILTNVFGELYICKPMSSRPGNSEIYIVGKYYKENKAITKRLENILYNWKRELIDIAFEPISEEFYLQLVYNLYYIYGRQKYFLDKILKLVELEYKNSSNLPKIIDILKRPDNDESKKENNFRSNIVRIWKKLYPIKPILDKDKL